MQNSADVLQQTIPDLMTQTVVHLFEVVNVDHDASERVVAPRGPRGLRGDGLSVWMGCSLHIQDRVASVEEARHVAERRENLRKEPRDEGSTIRRTAAGLASRIASSRLTNSMPRPISRIVKSRTTGRGANSPARRRPQTRATVERENATGRGRTGGRDVGDVEETYGPRRKDGDEKCHVSPAKAKVLRESRTSAYVAERRRAAA